MSKQFPKIFSTVSDLFHIYCVHLIMFCEYVILKLCQNTIPIFLWVIFLWFFFLIAVFIFFTSFNEKRFIEFFQYIFYLLLRSISDPLFSFFKLILQLTIITEVEFLLLILLITIRVSNRVWMSNIIIHIEVHLSRNLLWFFSLSKLPDLHLSLFLPIELFCRKFGFLSVKLFSSSLLDILTIFIWLLRTWASIACIRLARLIHRGWSFTPFGGSSSFSIIINVVIHSISFYLSSYPTKCKTHLLVASSVLI